MIHIHELGIQPYETVFNDMALFTQQRNDQTTDEIWLLEHFPVYTQGQAGKAEHILNRSAIPIIQSDRGGQITYHGPGQLVAYTLLDIQRRRIGVRTLVHLLEQALITLLSRYDIAAERHCNAPGVYVREKKIASIGLRVRKGCTYHGIALNVAMDLKPFTDINPCGFSKLSMTQIQDYAPHITLQEVSRQLTKELLFLFEQ